MTKTSKTDRRLPKHRNARTCYLCKDEFTRDNPKVRDYDHYTGKYRGAACRDCNNLKYKRPLFTSVLLHNLSSYNCHLFVRNLEEDKCNLKLIPDNEEKYISLRF